MAYEGEIRVRVFGTDECERCQTLKKLLHSAGVAFDFLDANADENIELCDAQGIDALPHVQAFHVESETILYNHTGFIAPKDLMLKIKSAVEKLNDPNIKSSRTFAPKKRGCSECGD